MEPLNMSLKNEVKSVKSLKKPKKRKIIYSLKTAFGQSFISQLWTSSGCCCFPDRNVRSPE